MLLIKTSVVNNSVSYYNTSSVGDVKKYLSVLDINRSIVKQRRLFKDGFSVLVDMSDRSTRYIRNFRRERKEQANPQIRYTCTIKRKGLEFVGQGWNRKDALISARVELKRHRNNCRAVYTQTRSIYLGRNADYSRYDLVGMIHTSSGTFLKLQAEKRSVEIYKNKTPKDSTKYLSYELEFFTPQEFKRGDIASKLMAAGVAEYVTLKGDGSVRGRKDTDQTHELVVCSPRSMLESITAKVTQVLDECRADVNDTCGFHVHLDMRDKSKYEVDRIFSNLVSAQHTLFRMMPPSRKNGRSSGGTNYCAPNRAKQFDKNLNTRYKAINACAYSKYRTLEVRLHSGTVNYEKIIRFIQILEHVAETPDTIMRSATTIPGFAKQFNLPRSLTNYIEARVAKFSAAHSSDTRGSTTELEQ